MDVGTVVNDCLNKFCERNAYINTDPCRKFVKKNGEIIGFFPLADEYFSDYYNLGC